MQIPSSIITMLVGIAVTLLSLWYGQNHGLLPVQASAEAGRVDELFNTMMTIGFGLFLLVEGTLILSIIRFRRRKGDETDGPHIEGNVPLEILWTSIPAVIVLGISVYSFEIYTEMGGLDLMSHNHTKHNPVQLAYASSGDSHSSFPMTLLGAAGLGQPPQFADQPADVEVNVTGLQYAFIFNYPDTGIVDGELHVPRDQLVRLNLSAQDVIHAFWLPEFRIKQDLIPGEETTLVFKATREGTYPVVCAELCGPYHGGMKTQLIVHSPEEYDNWVQSRVASQAATDEAIATLPGQPKTDAAYLAQFTEPLQLALDPSVLSDLHPHHP